MARPKQRQRQSKPLAERFAEKWQLDPQTGCWVWAGKRRPDGYGVIWDSIESGRELRAHRVSYERYVGPIPADCEIDHLCRNRGCVNPAHLEAVSRRTNFLRGQSGAAINAHKRFCKRGHELTKENTYLTKSGYRNCRACHRIYEAISRERRRAGLPVKNIASLF